MKLLSIIALLTCALSCRSTPGEVARKIGTTLMPDRLDIGRGAGLYTSNRRDDAYIDETWRVTVGWDLFTLDEDHRHDINTKLYREMIAKQERTNELAEEANKLAADPHVVYVEEPPVNSEDETSEWSQIEKIAAITTSLILAVGALFGVRAGKTHPE